MPGFQHLVEQSATAYLYDGTLPGLYSLVHACIYAHELPASIAPEGSTAISLFQERHIPTDMQKATRVRNSIRDKISLRALELTETVFYSCLAQKELHILRFLLLGYDKGACVTLMLAHPDVHPLLKAEKNLWGEQHLLTGFVRFSDYGKLLAATISPKNFVLPFLANHFISRFSQENFMIYDKTHKVALLYENQKPSFLLLEELRLAPPTQQEQAYQALWKQFYHTIAIEARINPKCRMTHMPKRYWENMLEVQDLL